MKIQQITKVLIANRGVIVNRIMRTLRLMGLKVVVIYSDADKELEYVRNADEAYYVGESVALKSYLDQEKIIAIAKIAKVDAIHPGYGFLSENADFAAEVVANNILFIGPSVKWLKALGHKTQARTLMSQYGMPLVASSSVLHNEKELLAKAREIGFPVLIKPADGGGGIGMLPVYSEDQLLTSWEKAKLIAFKAFGSSELYLERLVEKPRHIEFQVLADKYGAVQIIFERDCSVQRRNQKIIEEAKAPNVPLEEITAITKKLEQILTTLGYDVIGTVEMLYTKELGFVFLEMNTRLQVEHAVTEELTGIDIVEAQIKLAQGYPLNQVLPIVKAEGHAIEVRLYAEDSIRFLPSTGTLTSFNIPQSSGIRVETCYREGDKITPFYDPLIAKVISKANIRSQAIEQLKQFLTLIKIEGIKTNIPFVLRVLENKQFQDGLLSTSIVNEILATSN